MDRENKSLTIKYFVRLCNSKKNVNVCQKAFINILQISKHRVQGVVKRFYSSGCMAKENRGGDTRSKSYSQKLHAVNKFICSFSAIENHFCRSKTSDRVYLNSEHNIKKMWRLYQSQITDESLRVKHWYFRNVFTPILILDSVHQGLMSVQRVFLSMKRRKQKR